VRPPRLGAHLVCAPPPPPPPLPAPRRRARAGLLQLFSGYYIPVSQMVQNWRWFYYLTGTAQAFRFLGLPQVNCPPALANCPNYLLTMKSNVTKTVVAQYEWSQDPDAYWVSYGWLWVIALVFFALSILSYRFLNWTKR
jgi:hypothetical protein